MYTHQIKNIEILDKVFTLELALATAQDILDKPNLIVNTTGKTGGFMTQSSELLYQKSNIEDQGLKVEDVQELPVFALKTFIEAVLGKNAKVEIFEKGDFIKKFDVSFELIDNTSLEIKDSKSLSTRKFSLYSDSLSLVTKGKLTPTEIKTYYNTLASIIKNETSLVNDTSISQKDLYEKTPVAVLDKVAKVFITDQELEIEKKTN